jgi:hypothetical protein
MEIPFKWFKNGSKRNINLVMKFFNTHFPHRIDFNTDHQYDREKHRENLVWLEERFGKSLMELRPQLGQMKYRVINPDAVWDEWENQIVFKNSNDLLFFKLARVGR